MTENCTHRRLLSRTRLFKKILRITAQFKDLRLRARTARLFTRPRLPADAEVSRNITMGEESREHLYKVLVIGEYGVGKTSRLLWSPWYILPLIHNRIFLFLQGRWVRSAQSVPTHNFRLVKTVAFLCSFCHHFWV